MASQRDINETVDKLAAAWASLSRLGSELTENEWKTPSQLPAWNVQDNLSHLVGFESDMQGLPRPDHTAADKSHVKNAVGDSNEDDVDLRRSYTGAQVLKEWNTITADRLNTLRSASLDYFDEQSDTPAGRSSMFEFLQIRILDSWVHEQDMRRVLGKYGHQSGPVAEHTIDRLIRTLPIVVGKRAGTPPGETVVFHITNHVTRTIAITMQEARAAVVQDIPSNALATISMDSDVFLQLATGRASYAQLSSDVVIAGDTELGHKIVSQFNMMI
jgi:uncharacterized protein (TIGR03083 family)